MASSRDIKRRIDSIRGTRKITRAMELVASAKLRRGQERIEALRPYATALRVLMIQAAAQSRESRGLPLLEDRPEIRRGVVVTITGDRGLAGAFNVNILRRAQEVAREMQAEGAEEVVFVAVGKKGIGTLRFRGLTIDRTFEGFSVAPVFSDAQNVSEHLVNQFTEGGYDRVVLVYNEFKSVLEQNVVVEQLLPIPREVVEEVDLDEHGDADEVPSPALAFFEPEPHELLTELLPTYIENTIFRALLESAAAELAARRAAMRNATDNAGVLIDKYTLAMNRARQAAITQEILEVVSGADALK